jgi:MFS family permease
VIPSRPYLVLIGSVLMALVGWGAGYIVVVALKPIAAEFGWPRAVPSLAFSFQFVGQGVGGVVMGYLLDRAGMLWPALIGSVSIAVGALAASVIDAAWQLYVIYGLVIGLFGVGSLSAPLMANIMRWFEHRRGMAVGIVASGQTLAGILWPPVIAIGLGSVGWRDTYLWYGVLALCLMLPLSLIVGLRPPNPVGRAEGTKSSAAPPRSSARPMPVPSRTLSPKNMQITLCGAIVGCCVAMALPLAHLVSYVTDLGHPVTNAVEILSVTLFAAFVTRLVVVGLMADRWGGLRSLAAFSGLQAAALALLTAVDGLAALYILAALFGFGYGGIFPVYSVTVREHMPAHEAGRRIGVIFLFGAVAMGFGSWMGGVLFDATGTYTLAFLIGVAFNVVNIAVVAFLLVRTGPVVYRPALG